MFGVDVGTCPTLLKNAILLEPSTWVSSLLNAEVRNSVVANTLDEVLSARQVKVQEA